MIRHLLFPLCLLTVTPTLGGQGAGDTPPVAVYKAMDEYELVRENLELTINEPGRPIRGVLGMGDTLERRDEVGGWTVHDVHSRRLSYTGAEAAHGGF